MRRVPAKTYETLQNLTAAFYEAVEIVDDLHDKATDYFDARSERWQESDKGSAYEEWRDAFDSARDEVQAALDALEAINQSPGSEE